MVIPRSGSRDMPCDVCGAPTDLVDDRFTCTVCGAWAKNSPKAGKLGIMADSRTHQYRSMCWTHYRPAAIRVGWKEYRKTVLMALLVPPRMADPHFWDKYLCRQYLRFINMGDTKLKWKTQVGPNGGHTYFGYGVTKASIATKLRDNFEPGTVLEWVVKEFKSTRSLAQNGYYWDELVPGYQRALREMWGEEYTTQYIHEKKLLPVFGIDPGYYKEGKEPRLRHETRRAIVPGRSEPIEVEVEFYEGVTTTNMTTMGFKRYMAAIRTHARNDLNFVIREPDPDYKTKGVSRA